MPESQSDSSDSVLTQGTSPYTSAQGWGQPRESPASAPSRESLESGYREKSPSTTTSRPNHREKSAKKNRRPDKQLYVPRSRRTSQPLEPEQSLPSRETPSPKQRISTPQTNKGRTSPSRSPSREAPQAKKYSEDRRLKTKQKKIKLEVCEASSSHLSTPETAVTAQDGTVQENNSEHLAANQLLSSSCRPTGAVVEQDTSQIPVQTDPPEEAICIQTPLVSLKQEVAAVDPTSSRTTINLERHTPHEGLATYRVIGQTSAQENIHSQTLSREDTSVETGTQFATSLKKVPVPALKPVPGEHQYHKGNDLATTDTLSQESERQKITGNEKKHSTTLQHLFRKSVSDRTPSEEYRDVDHSARAANQEALEDRQRNPEEKAEAISRHPSTDKVQESRASLDSARSMADDVAGDDTKARVGEGDEKRVAEIMEDKDKVTSGKLERKDAEGGKVEDGAGQEEEEEEDSWDTMFDDEGNSLKEDEMKEITDAVGGVSVSVKKPAHEFYKFSPKDTTDYTKLEHVIEAFDFPESFKMQELLMAFSAFKGKGFDIKWVDDTHALIVFASSQVAADALGLQNPMMRTRPLELASKQSKEKARAADLYLQPYKPRPETSSTTARRMVASALGIKSTVSKEERAAERQKLKEAREKKREGKKQEVDSWEGNI